MLENLKNVLEKLNNKGISDHFQKIIYTRNLKEKEIQNINQANKILENLKKQRE